MHARSALFDLYGDHLRGRGSQAPVAAIVRLLAPGRHRRSGGAHGDLADGDAGLAGAGRPRQRPRLPHHRAAPTAGSTRPATGSTGGTIPEWDGAWHLAVVDPPRVRSARTRLRADLGVPGVRRAGRQRVGQPVRARRAGVGARAGRRHRAHRPGCRRTPGADGGVGPRRPAGGVRRLAGQRGRPGRRAARGARRTTTRRRSPDASTSCTSGGSSCSPTPACPRSCCRATGPARPRRSCSRARPTAWRPARTGSSPAAWTTPRA